MLTGKRPFDDESKVKLLGKHITASVPPLPPELQVTPELEALVMKLLAKDPNDRVQEAREAIEAFDGLVTPPPSAVSSGLLPVASVSRPSLSSLDSIKSGTNPTVLAMKAHATSLATDVTRSVPPKVLIGAAVAIGALVLTSIIVVVTHGSSPSASGSSSAAPQLPKPSAKFERELKAAQAELGAGRLDNAVAQARALATENPTRPEPERLLFQVHVAKGDTKAALADAGQWLALDPSGASDVQLRDTIKGAASSREDMDAAFALLESGKMGAAGAEMLYDLAYGSGTTSQVASRAKKALGHAEATSKAGPALQISIELREAKTCEAKKELLPRASLQGDARTLSILEGYAKKGGCGFLGLSDCYGCMRKDDVLEKATAALRER